MYPPDDRVLHEVFQLADALAEAAADLRRHTEACLDAVKRQQAAIEEAMACIPTEKT